MSGQVKADYIDQLAIDLISPERQWLNWANKEVIPLEAWGQKRIKQLLRILRDRRGERRRKEIEDKVFGFSGRLEKLPEHERRTIKRALTRLGSIATLKDSEFKELGDGMLLAWEQGRLRELIDEIAENEDRRLMHCYLCSQRLKCSLH